MSKNTYEYTGINESTTVTLKAGEKLSEINAKAVKLTEEGIALPAAGEEAVGIVLITEDETFEKGDAVSVQMKDIGLWKAGAEISLGALLATDEEGFCQTATAGQWVMARALSAATAKGDIIKVQIIHAGKLSAAASTGN